MVEVNIVSLTENILAGMRQVGVNYAKNKIKSSIFDAFINVATQQLGQLSPEFSSLLKALQAADVRVRNERGEFHQDVLLRERLTPAQLRELGFDASTARLEVWTEFQEAPAPAIQTAVVRCETNATVRARMAEPDLLDQRLDFGVMRMDLHSGKAFAEPALENPARVLKEWKEIGGRRFLIESSTLDWKLDSSVLIQAQVPCP